jgi:biotin synthase
MEEKYIKKAKEMLDRNYDYYMKAAIIEKLKYADWESEMLWTLARSKREETIGNKMFIRGSLEYNNICSNHCCFCGMSDKNKKLKRYILSVDEAKNAINKLVEHNITQLHLVGGEDNSVNIDDICSIVKYATMKSIAVTLVLGELNKERYEKLYDAGAKRYILKFETSNRELFYKYKSNKCLENRIAHLLLLRDIGFKIGTGIIVGLPNTTYEDLAKDLMLLTRINPDMASASVFSPNAESDLKDSESGDIKTTLNFISLMRLYLSDTPIISCSSSFGKEGQYRAMNAGANLISYHITPKEYSDNFSMYKSENRVKTQYENIILCKNKLGLEIENYV